MLPSPLEGEGRISTRGTSVRNSGEGWCQSNVGRHYYADRKIISRVSKPDPQDTKRIDKTPGADYKSNSKTLSEAHRKELNVLTSYRLNDFKKKAGATHVDMSGNIRRVAFTLAEVLITLGIIGIVAAMTIPTLMTSYKKKIVESRLSKFYSIMNQAVKLSEIENGAVSTWEPISLMWEHDGEDQVVPDENVTGVKSNSYEWFNKYFAPYIKTIKVEKDDHDRDGTTRVYLSDGSLLLVGRMSWTFYPDAKDFKSVEYNDNNITDRDRSGAGTAFFSFRFTPGETDSLHTYDEQWDGTIDALKDHANYGCYNDDTTYERAYCAKLIQLNNWKIPDDYPWF